MLKEFFQSTSHQTNVALALEKRNVFYTGVEGLLSLFCNVGSTLASAICENKISRISEKNDILAYIQKSNLYLYLKRVSKRTQKSPT